MQILYLYDVKAKNKRAFNRTKRLFYYHLNKLALSRERWRTKSALVVTKKHEKTLDAFFRIFKGKVEVYKISVNTIQQIA